MIFGKLIRTTNETRWGRSDDGKGPALVLPAGTEGLVVTNLDRMPVTPAERAAIRETARHNAERGRPGVIVWLADRVRFLEATDVEYVETNRATLFQPAEAEAC